MSARPKHQGEPTLGQVMRRPQWLLMLLLALAVGGAFGFLAQWQMDSAIQLQETEVDTETVRPLAKITPPGAIVTDASAAMMASVQGSLVHEDTMIVTQRVNQGEVGAWVVGHVEVPAEGAAPAQHLTVALGWAETAEVASDRAEQIAQDPSYAAERVYVGRYMPSEGPVIPEPHEALPEGQFASLATGQLINAWQPFAGVPFSGFLVLDEEVAGLELIDSEPPLPQETINWLNLFYAIEWVVFAGFAVYFWYRLARDAWEKEHELRALEAAERANAPLTTS